jgi:hypothetical protein
MFKLLLRHKKDPEITFKVFSFLFGFAFSLKLNLARILANKKSRFRGTLLWFAEEEGVISKI